MLKRLQKESNVKGRSEKNKCSIIINRIDSNDDTIDNKVLY